jgi:MoaA/NifB/PqqE/SkfB family radical SAM enzyme
MDPTRIDEYHATRRFADKAFRSACYAPHVSMYFDTLGNVLACCQNVKYPVGNVTRERLLDVWRGPRARKLRRALEKNAFGAGCQFCEWQISVGNYANAFTRNFDRFPVADADPDWPQMMEFSVSNTCNLECIMCYGVLSSSIRARREGLPPLPKAYGDEFFEDLRAFLPHLKFAKFLGGEPFLAAESFRIWDLMEQEGVAPLCNVTTNGTQWNERVERILERFPVSICISMDGVAKETVESIRVNAKHETILQNFQRFLDYTRRRGTDLTLTYCLMRQNWREFGDYLLFADEHDCGVCVNLVREPAECSLYTLPLDELASIAEALERQGETLTERLGRNRSVWMEQTTALRRRVERAAESTRTPFDTPLALVVVDRAPPAPDPNRMTLEKAGGLLDESVGRDAPRLTFYSDQDDRIQQVDSPDGALFGLPCDECVGRTFAELVERLAERFGPCRTQQIHRTAEYVDRSLLFHQGSRGLLAIRFVSVPQMNEFGMPAGSATVCASRMLSEKNATTSPASAREALRRWDPDAAIVEIPLDPRGRVESIPPAEGEFRGWTDRLQLGATEAELFAACTQAWGQRERVHGVASIDGENFVHRFVRPSGLWIVRSIVAPRFQASKGHVGYVVLAAGTMLGRARIAASMENARRTLVEWAGCDRVLRLTFNRADEVVGVEAPAGGLFGLDEATCMDRTWGELAEALRKQFGAERLARWNLTPDSLDVVLHFYSRGGFLAFRSIELPRLNDAGRHTGVVRLAAAKRFGRGQFEEAERRAEEALAAWRGGGPTTRLRFDPSGRIASIDGATDEARFPPESELFGKTEAGLSEALSRSLGEAKILRWEERADGVDVVREFTRPGLTTRVRSIGMPQIEAGGECTGWLRIDAVRWVDAAEFSRLEREAVERLARWSGEDRLFRVFEGPDGVVARIEGPDEAMLNVESGSAIGEPLSELRRRWNEEFGEPRCSYWREDAIERDFVEERAAKGRFAAVREISAPCASDSEDGGGVVHWIAARVLGPDELGRLAGAAIAELRSWAEGGEVVRILENQHAEILDVEPADARLDAVELGSLRGRPFSTVVRDLQQNLGEGRFVQWNETANGTEGILEFYTPWAALSLRIVVLPIPGGESPLGAMRLLAVRESRVDEAADDEANLRARLIRWDPGAERLRLTVDGDGLIAAWDAPTFLGVSLAPWKGRRREEFEQALTESLPAAVQARRFRRGRAVDACLESRSASRVVAVRWISVASGPEEGSEACTAEYAGRDLNAATMEAMLADARRWLAEWAEGGQVLVLREDREGSPVEVRAESETWMGMQPGDFVGRTPLELAERMQAAWGRMTPVSNVSGSVYTDLLLAFGADEGRLLVRNIVLPDLRSPENARGAIRLVAAKRG